MADDLEFSGHWEGMDETNSMLSSLPRTMSRKIARRACRAGAKVIAAAMIAHAPVGPTGNTRRAIKVRAGKNRATRVSVMAQLTSRLLPKGIFYAGWANYGHIWSRKRRKQGKFEGVNGGRRTTNPIPQAGEKQVAGLHWLEKVEAESTPAAKLAFETTLRDECTKALKGQAVSE